MSIEWSRVRSALWPNAFPTRKCQRATHRCAPSTTSASFQPRLKALPSPEFIPCPERTGKMRRVPGDQQATATKGRGGPSIDPKHGKPGRVKHPRLRIARISGKQFLQPLKPFLRSNGAPVALGGHSLAPTLGNGVARRKRHTDPPCLVRQRYHQQYLIAVQID